MNCKNCGSPLAPGSVFCPNCGTKNEPAAPGFSPAPSNLRMSSSFSNGAAPKPATPPRTAAPTPAYPTAPTPAYSAAPTSAYSAAPTPAYSAAPTPAYSAAPAPGYPAPAYPAAPKKSKKPLIIAIAAVACVAILAVVLILALGGGTPKSPEQAVQQLANAMEKGDAEGLFRATGIDLHKYAEVVLRKAYEDKYDENIDDLRDAMVESFSGEKKWKDRAKKINTLDDAVSVAVDYSKEMFAEMAEDADLEELHDAMKDIDIQDATSSEKKNEIEKLESKLEKYEDALLFDVDDIEEVYYWELEGRKVAIVQTKQGCFIAGFLRYLPFPSF